MQLAQTIDIQSQDDFSGASKGQESRKRNGPSGASKQQDLKLPEDVQQAKKIR